MGEWEKRSREEEEEAQRLKVIKALKLSVAGVATAAIIMPVMFGSWYNVDEGERGVILRNGKYVDTAEPGLHFKRPIVDSVEFISVQDYTLRWEPLRAYSKDQQPANMAVSVTYKVLPTQVLEVYKSYGGIAGMEDRVLSRIVPNQIQNIFGQYTAVDSVQKRAELTLKAETAIKATVPTQVVEIVSVQIENVKFSEAYEQSVEERMKAEVAVATQKQNLERERVSAEIVETTAQGAAAATLAAARAEAEAIKLRGEAEAAAIKARADALKENDNLVDLVKAEKWNGVVPTHVLPNSTVPFLDTK